jgi:glycosyltransferase involved in cell wall biosynthesis
VSGIDVLYLTWNRREFTRFSLQKLLNNTDWSLVDRLIVHDDGSDRDEGTVALVNDMLHDQKPKVEVIVKARPWDVRFGSPPAVMNWYVENYGDSERFAKIDSDIVVPPGWLEALLSVVKKNPHVELLGMEAGRMGPPGHNGAPWDWDRPNNGYDFEKGQHIGGVGLMKTESFRIRPKLIEGEGRFGFTEWQHEYKPVRGWITPDLLVSELSRIPFEPWVSLTSQYVERDWEREWPKYHERWDYWWSWWPR